MNHGIIKAISISPERGTLKQEVKEAIAIQNFGIENDGHGGDWGRQVTCLDFASVEKSNLENNLTMGPGDFAENILIDGIDMKMLSVGDQLAIGETCVLEITQIGKPDHPSVVTSTFGVSLLPYEGLFCRVVKGGIIHKDDLVCVSNSDR